MNFLHPFLIGAVAMASEGAAKRIDYASYVREVSITGVVSVWLVSEVILAVVLLFMVAGTLGQKFNKSKLKSLGDAFKEIMGNFGQTIRAVVLTSVNFLVTYSVFAWLASNLMFPIVIAISFQIMIGYLIVLNTAEKIVAD